MKDSGIEWIGEIPDEWKLDKGKAMFRQRNERGNSIELQILSPSQQLGVVPQSLLEELTSHVAVKVKAETDLMTFKTMHKGDFCISLRSFQGGFEYSAYEGVVSPAYQVFYPFKPICNSFYKYLFKVQPFIDKMNSYTMTLRDGKNIAFSDFGNSYIPSPPIVVQYKIADILDEKCAKIDRLIAHEEATIEELKAYKQSVITEAVTKGVDKSVPMKDSGVEWIGKIPKHWNVGRIKYFCKMINGYAFNSNDFGREFLYKVIRIGDIENNTVNQDTCLTIASNEGLSMYQVRTGDAVIALSGATVGKMGMVNFLSDCFYINQRVAILRSPYIRYIKYILQTQGFIEYMKLISIGSAQPNLSTSEIGNYYFLLSSDAKQIIDFLDKKCADIDNLITIKQQKIEELKEYRKSLIYEYVTGKKEVA